MVTKRTPGEGSVTPLGPGRFWARAPGTRRSLGVYATEDLAHAAIYAHVTKSKRLDGETFADFGKKVLDWREEDGIRGIGTERRRFTRHLATAPFAGLPVPDVKPVDVSDWLRALGRKQAADKKGTRKLSRKTVQRCFSLASCVFTTAIERGIRPDNPCAGVKLRRADAEAVEQTWDWLRGDEQKKLATCEEIPEWARLLVLFAVFTGLRQGEQWNLELRDLHVKGDDPHVFVRFGSKGMLPKSGKTRKVALFGDGLAVAKRWLEILPTYAPKNEFGLVFPTTSGLRRPKGAPEMKSWDPVKKKNVRVEALPVWLKAAGIKRQVRWHDLRHTCASSLVSGTWGHRWTLDEVREHLGHSSILVTQIYAHLAEDTKKASVARTGVGFLGYDKVTGNGGAGSSVAVIVNDSDMVGRDGIEPSTYGLKGPDVVQVLRDLGSSHNPAVTALADALASVLEQGVKAS